MKRGVRKLEKRNLKGNTMKGRSSWGGNWASETGTESCFSKTRAWIQPSLCVQNRKWLWFIEKPLCRSTCRDNLGKPHYLTFLHRKHVGSVVSWALIREDWILCCALTTPPRSMWNLVFLRSPFLSVFLPWGFHSFILPLCSQSASGSLSCCCSAHAP